MDMKFINDTESIIIYPIIDKKSGYSLKINIPYIAETSNPK